MKRTHRAVYQWALWCRSHRAGHRQSDHHVRKRAAATRPLRQTNPSQPPLPRRQILHDVLRPAAKDLHRLVGAELQGLRGVVLERANLHYPPRARMSRVCTRGRMATVAVNEFIFKQPVRASDICPFFAHVMRIGRTSVTVEVEVYSERLPGKGSI